MIVTARHHEGIASQIFFGHEPGRPVVTGAFILQTPYTDPFTLADSVEGEADVLTNHPIIRAS